MLFRSCQCRVRVYTDFLRIINCEWVPFVFDVVCWSIGRVWQNVRVYGNCCTISRTLGMRMIWLHVVDHNCCNCISVYGCTLCFVDLENPLVNCCDANLVSSYVVRLCLLSCGPLKILLVLRRLQLRGKCRWLSLGLNRLHQIGVLSLSGFESCR